MKFFALYKRYRAYVGKKVAQFENNVFESNEYDVYVALKKDANVTIPAGQTPPEAPVAAEVKPVIADPVVKAKK
jgi:ribosome-associated translation inhibitor RaiA